MGADWEVLSKEVQYLLAHAAFEEAVEMLSERAEVLAQRIESGAVADQGGAEALRTFAKLARFQVRNIEPSDEG